jgi:hypothetical protein
MKKTFSEYMKEQKAVTEVVHSQMLGFEEMVKDMKFVEFVEKLSDSILEKLSIFEVYQKYLKEVKRKK